MIQFLPTLNAVLNSLSTLFIISGFFFIKRNNRVLHKFSMLGAILTSTLFLISYGIYHFTKTGITKFQGEGILKFIYLVILGTHSILALVIVPLIFLSVHKALKEDHTAHKKLVKWTFPLWLYVSVTGVLIYLALYQMY